MPNITQKKFQVDTPYSFCIKHAQVTSFDFYIFEITVVNNLDTPIFRLLYKVEVSFTDIPHKKSLGAKNRLKRRNFE